MAIQDYDISIEYCPEKNNLSADTLSRLPEQGEVEKMAHSDGKIILYALEKKAIIEHAKSATEFCPRAKIIPYFGTENQR